MKVLILGSKGSLGQTFLDIYSDWEAIGYDREDLDITNERQVLEAIRKLKPDLVINCAAYNAVDRAETERGLADNINGYAVGYIAKACDETDTVLIHYSTNYVFDGKNPEGYNEDDPPKPQSAYARSKLLGEMELQNNTKNFYLIRTQWLYGKPSIGGKPSFVETMLKLASERKPIKSINDEFGQPTFVYDLASATRAIVEEKKPFGVYHLTNSGQATWYDWAKEIFLIKSMDADLSPISRTEYVRPAERPQYGMLKNSKFIQLRPWAEALREHLSQFGNS